MTATAIQYIYIICLIETVCQLYIQIFLFFDKRNILFVYKVVQEYRSKILLILCQSLF